MPSALVGWQNAQERTTTKAVDTGASGSTTGLTGYKAVPSLSAGVTVTAGTNAYGSWAVITTGLAFDFYIVGIQVGLTTAVSADLTYYQLALGIGASQVQVSEFKLFGADFQSGVGTTPLMATWLPYPVRVGANTQVSARSAANALTPAAAVSLTVIRADDLLLA